MNRINYKVTVIGSGNVGSQFARIFNTLPVSSRFLENFPLDSDLYVIAVSDDAVSEVAARLPEVRGIVVHTTGSVPMDALACVRCGGYGVLYPFQTISKARSLPAGDIPLLVEAVNPAVGAGIMEIARSFGFSSVVYADSELRRRVHLAGTFVCNFTNALVGIGQRIFSECGIDSSIANPLISETMEKLRHIPASQAQTGPAVRGDLATLEKHRRLLTDLGMSRELEIYDIMSGYIMDQKK